MVTERDMLVRVGRMLRRWLRSKKFGVAVINIPYELCKMGEYDACIIESEARTREMLRIAESMTPCVVWVDELEWAEMENGS